MAYFMLSTEKKMSMIGGPEDPKKFKPKKFEFPQLYPKPPIFYSYNEERAVDVVFLIDATGSMEFLIETVLDSLNDIATYCQENCLNNSLRFGAVVKEIKRHLLHGKWNCDETEYSGILKNF